MAEGDRARALTFNWIARESSHSNCGVWSGQVEGIFPITAGNRTRHRST